MADALGGSESTHGPARVGGDVPYWPEGTVRALLATDLVTAATRTALRSRLDLPTVVAPIWFSGDEFETLVALCARLIPQTDRAERVDLPGEVDRRLANCAGDGWRYAEMPPDPTMHRRGLRGLNETAQMRFGLRFKQLEAACQDAVLAAVQRGEAPGETWRTLSAGRYFEELLAELVDIYYAHPLAQEEIGFVGMADAQGWQAIGLDQHEPHEPSPIGDAGPEAARG